MLNKDILLQAYQALTGACFPLWNWKFDSAFNVISSDCPHESLYKTLLLEDGRQKAILEHAEQNVMPLICTIQPMLSWITAFEHDSAGRLAAVYIKGPFFNGVNDPKSYNPILRPLKLGADAEKTLADSLQDLPMLTSSSILQLALMLHYSIHESVIGVDDIGIHTSRMPMEQLTERVTTDQFHGSDAYWDIENEILNKVRNGELDIGEVMERAAARPSSVNDINEKSIDLYRQNVHLLLTLVSRAAVEGGLPRKSSFSLCANYRKDLNKCKTIAEISMLSNDMLADYVQRVHRLKDYQSCSRQIRLCCEYIDTHLEEKLTLSFLAGKAGYSEYHLSRKFKQEMNISIIDYIKNAKLERAKFLLSHTRTSIDEIADSLGYSSRSYFSTVFREKTGSPPSDYRDEHALI